MEPLTKHLEHFLSLTNNKNFVLVRHGESMANMSGSICGWTDVRLSYKGREQAHSLFQHFHKYIHKFTGIYSSDLERAHDSAKLALGFPGGNIIKTDRRLREMYYGEEEGNHFDGLPQAEKDKINSFDYKPKGGETWPLARARMIDFFSSVPNGNYLIFTHGGLMCYLTSTLGVDYILPNSSCVGIRTNEQSQPDKLLFKWVYEDLKEI